MNTKRSKSKKVGAIVFAIAMVFGMGIGTMGTAMAGEASITGTITGVETTIDIALGIAANTAVNNYYLDTADEVQNILDADTSTIAKAFATTSGTTTVTVAIDGADKALPTGAQIKLVSGAAGGAVIPVAVEGDANVYIDGIANVATFASDGSMTITSGHSIYAFLQPDGVADHTGAVNTKLTVS